MTIHAAHRRSFLAALGALATGGPLLNNVLAGALDQDTLIKAVDREVIFHGRNARARRASAKGAWFHPRACVIPTADGPLGFMTVQRTTGSDYFHPVCWSTSNDLGKTWTNPKPVPGMGRKPFNQHVSVGVCDVAPEYHQETNTVLAIGHNVYYTKGHFFKGQPPRWPAYAVRDALGQWTPLRKLEWDDPRGSQIYTCGCSQRVTLPNGDLLVALSFAPKGRANRMVTSVRCEFDGRAVTVKQSGDTLELGKKRGLLEPSLTAFGERFWMTIRAEDNRGYLAVSDDGLRWSSQKPWTWSDGKPLTMSTTQQHWLTHSDGLFLVYTRSAQNNKNVFRWRAPLFLAQLDTERRCLLRDTEQVVFPLVGDGVKQGKHVARMGNFHVNNATPSESWITVGESRPTKAYCGDTLLAHVRWSRPNRLVTSSK